MICTTCSCCETICECGESQVLEEAGFCENCGTIATLEELEVDGFCSASECQEAYE